MLNKFQEVAGSGRITRLLAQGSLYVAISLTGLLLTYDIANASLFRFRFWVGCAIILYFLLVLLLVKNGRINTANWLIILLYELLAGVLLTYWGLNSSVGILTAAFAILLPGVLMTPQYILLVTLITLVIIVIAHGLHVVGAVIPISYIPPTPSSILDIIAYSTILSVFALVSWVSAHQSKQSLRRALSAEEKLRAQKDVLSLALEQESSQLRQAQLQQIQQLYKFAVIGQSAIATLHELSNHLSVLNLDIDDIKQQSRNSRAIANAEEGIEYMNRMVRKARSHLNNENEKPRLFDAYPVVRQSVDDILPKITQHKIKLTKDLPRKTTTTLISGDPMNLMQCISILLNNAIDACSNHVQPEIKIATRPLKGRRLEISISDNGPGISKEIREQLFHPLKSSKESGLGVGLYIAKHLIETQFGGEILFADTKSGTHFKIILNKAQRSR